MKPLYIAAICILSLQLTSCLKQVQSTVVQGQVIDNVTGKGVPFAKIKLSQNGSGYVHNPTGLGTFTADGDGHFEKTFEGDVNGIFELYAEKLYYNNPRGLSDFTFQGNGKRHKNITLKLHPVCYVWLHIKSTGVHNLAILNSWQISKPKDTTFLSGGFANEENKVVMFCYKQSNELPNPEDTIKKYYFSAPPFDTTHLYMEY